MKFFKYALFLALMLVGLAAGGCAADGSFLWEDGRYDHDNDNDNSWDDDDDWRSRTGDWKESRDGDWADRPDPKSSDEREDYWDDFNSDDYGSDDYGSNDTWTWGAQSYQVPRKSEMDDIRTLAKTMDQTADDLMDELRDNSRLRDTLGRSAGPADTLRTMADNFRRQVEDNMTRPDRTLTAFQELRNSHTRLAEDASRHDLSDRMERMLDRLVETANALDRLYLRKHV